MAANATVWRADCRVRIDESTQDAPEQDGPRAKRTTSTPASMPRSSSSTIAVWVIAGMLVGLIADLALDEFPFYIGLGGVVGLLAGFLIAAWRK